VAVQIIDFLPRMPYLEFSYFLMSATLDCVSHAPIMTVYVSRCWAVRIDDFQLGTLSSSWVECHASLFYPSEIVVKVCRPGLRLTGILFFPAVYRALRDAIACRARTHV
jgi:hypothetical protein